MSEFPDTFFEALSSEGGGDAAMRVLREAAFNNGLEHEPSPRAQPFFSDGEWESARTLLPLTLVESDACFGNMANLSTPRGSSYHRFCGKARSKCDIRSHQTSKLRVDLQRSGWYLAGGSGRQGSILEIRFPLLENGGPINQLSALRLLDPDRPFRMSLGQWLFVHNEWTSQRVESMSSWESPLEAAPEGGSRTLPLLGVKTYVPTEDSPHSPAGGPVDVVDEESLQETDPPSLETVHEDTPTIPPGAAVPSTTAQRLLSMCESQQHRIATLEGQIRGLLGELRNSENRALEESTRRDSTQASLKGRLDTVERVLRTVAAAQRDEAEYKTFVGSVEHSLFSPHGDVAELKTQVKALQQRFDSEGSIECHGVHFSSKVEMAAWFEKNGLTIGVFADAVALLHTIQAPVVHQAEATKTMEAQQKVSMHTDLEAAIITSFSTILPSILVGNKKEGTGGTFDWLKSYLKDYSVWDPSGRKSGVSSRIKEGIKVATKRSEGLLSLTTNDPEAVKVASGLLSDSATFVTSLCMWVESAHRDITADTPYNSEEVWDMLLECLEQIFEELHQARVAVVDAARISQGIYLWGMLKAWQIQQRYVSNDFQDDPALTGIFVRRVLLHGHDVSLEDRLEKLTDGLKRADEHDRQMSSDTRQLQREVKEMKTSLKELKAKLPN